MTHELEVTEVCEIRGRGTAVFFTHDPDPWWPLGSYAVEVVTPQGNYFNATAHLELARKVPQGEVMALIFSNHSPPQIPVGSKIKRLLP